MPNQNQHSKETDHFRKKSSKQNEGYHPLKGEEVEMAFEWDLQSFTQNLEAKDQPISERSAWH